MADREDFGWFKQPGRWPGHAPRTGQRRLGLRLQLRRPATASRRLGPAEPLAAVRMKDD